MPLSRHRGHHRAAAAIADTVWNDGGFRLVEIIRDGPRFLTARVASRSQTGTFKLCLLPDTIDTHSNTRLARETYFLERVKQKRPPFLSTVVPKLIAAGYARSRRWHIREYFAGRTFSRGGSAFFFRTGFFSAATLNTLVQFTESLARFSTAIPTERRPLFSNNPALRFSSDVIWWQALQPYLPVAALRPVVERFFAVRADLYNRRRVVLSHQELYPPHLIAMDRSYKIIDWENIGFANAARDLSVIWMRSFEVPAWQSRLAAGWLSRQPNRREGRRLWEVELLMQSLKNITYFHTTTDPVDRRRRTRAIAFCAKTVVSLLKEYHVRPS